MIHHRAAHPVARLLSLAATSHHMDGLNRIWLVGYSLGGNLVLKAAAGLSAAALTGAIAVCPTIDPTQCAKAGAHVVCLSGRRNLTESLPFHIKPIIERIHVPIASFARRVHRPVFQSGRARHCLATAMMRGVFWQAGGSLVVAGAPGFFGQVLSHESGLNSSLSSHFVKQSSAARPSRQSSGRGRTDDQDRPRERPVAGRSAEGSRQYAQACPSRSRARRSVR